MLKHKVMGDVVVLTLRGRIDINTNAELADEIKKIVAQNLDKNFVIDMSEVEYISSSGLGVFVTIKRELAIENKLLNLAGLQPPVVRIFDVSGMREHFNIYEDQRSALDAF